MVNDSFADLYPSAVHSESAQMSGFSVVRSWVNIITT